MLTGTLEGHCPLQRMNASRFQRELHSLIIVLLFVTRQICMVPKETVTAHSVSAHCRCVCRRRIWNEKVGICKEWLGFLHFSETHFWLSVAHWASQSAMSHWSHIRYVFIPPMALNNPWWKAVWVEIWVPRVSQINAHTITQWSVMGFIRWFFHKGCQMLSVEQLVYTTQT